MIPTRLNLLSTQKQQHIKTMIYMQTIMLMMQVFFILVALAAIIMLGSRYFLEEHFAQINAIPINSEGSYAEVKDQVDDVNMVLRQASAVQAVYEPFSDDIQVISQAIPTGSTISSLLINKRTKILTVSGVSDTRDDLLALRSALETLPMTKVLEFPTSLLSEKEDIRFTLNITLK